jgi:hypothetical protein
MILFDSDIEESIRLGKEACAKYVNPKMPPPMKLLFENVKYPFCLLGKKKYISFEWGKSPREYLGNEEYVKILKSKGSPEERAFELTREKKIKYGPKFSAKGTVSKRRDACLFIKKLISKIVDILVGIIKPPSGMSKIAYAIKVAVDGVSDVMSGNVRYQDIIMSKSLQKPILEYENELVQTTYKIIQRMKVDKKDLKKIKDASSDARKRLVNNVYQNFFYRRTITNKLHNKYGKYWILKAIEYVAVSEYKLPERKRSAPEHVVIALKKGKRSPGEEPTTGNRVSFVLVKKQLDHVKGSSDVKIGDIAEDPDYALKNGMELDYEEIAKRYVIKALCRLFGPIIGSHTFDHIDYENLSKQEIEDKTNVVIKKNREEVRKLLFSRQNVNHRITFRKWGSMMQFVKVIPKCVGCGCRLRDTVKRRKLSMDGHTFNEAHENFLCKDCQPNRRGILTKILQKRRELTTEEQAVQIQCMLCQQNRYGFAKCANSDCEYFYLRRELIKDIEDLDEKLYRTLCSIDAINTKGDSSTLFIHRRTDKNILNKTKRIILQEYGNKKI